MHQKTSKSGFTAVFLQKRPAHRKLFLENRNQPRLARGGARSRHPARHGGPAPAPAATLRAPRPPRQLGGRPCPSRAAAGGGGSFALRATGRSHSVAGRRGFTPHGAPLKQRWAAPWPPPPRLPPSLRANSFSDHHPPAIRQHPLLRLPFRSGAASPVLAQAPSQPHACPGRPSVPRPPHFSSPPFRHSHSGSSQSVGAGSVVLESVPRGDCSSACVRV